MKARPARCKEPIYALALALDFLWSPPEWLNDHYEQLTLRDPELMELCRKANFEIWQKKKFAAARALCDDLAKALQGIKLGFPTPKDFVVFVVDFSSGRKKGDLACV